VFYFVIPIFFVEGGMDEGFIMSFLVLLFVVQFVMIFVSTIFMVLMGLFAPVYMTHMVADGSFKAMFQIKQWWKIFVKGFWEFLISFMLVYGLSMLLYYVFFTLLYSVVCCCLAPFVIGLGTVYLMAVYFALIACAYRDGRDKSPVEKQALPAGDKPAEAPAAISSPKPAEEAPAISAPAVEVEAAPAPETAEEFELPSPDGEAVEAAPELDATQVSGVNQEVAAAMGFANATIKMDDLKKINGIGPKTASVLKQNGIMNFEQLAAIDVAHLKDILTANGLEIVAAACEDWPQQAKDLL
jgi:predicted flap endonuclease-1-like 5' DNA nuclease